MTSPLVRSPEESATPSTHEHPCPECEHPAPGRYCPNCGQRQGPLRVSLGELFHEWVEEFLHFDSKLVHTVGPLLFRPGFLTAEYVRGRRTRYLRPFRVWFTFSVLYFVLLALMPGGAGPTHIQKNPGQDAQRSASSTPHRPAQEDAPSAFEQEIDGLADRLTKQNDAATAEKKIQSTASSDGPHLALILVPLFAVLLKLLYRRTPLGEHFVFSFHLHAFHAVVSLGVLLLELSRTVRDRYSLVQLIPFAAVAIYLPAALQRVHAQGWLRTFNKAGPLFLAYLFFFALLQLAFFVLTALQV